MGIKQKTIDNILHHARFRGRMVDYIAVGLNMLLNQDQNALPLVYCATGRPFCYVVDKSKGGIVPSASFSQSLERAIDALNLSEYMSLTNIDMESASFEDYSEKIQSMLNIGSVLIGPFAGIHFEKELTTVYRPTKNHCVLCVEFANGVAQLIHPDGLFFQMRIEELLKYHRGDKLEKITLLTRNEPCPDIICSNLFNRTFNINIARLKTYQHKELFSSFLVDFASYVNQAELKTSEVLMYRLGMHELSLSLLHVHEMMQMYLHCFENKATRASELEYIDRIVASLIKILSNLLSEKYSKWSTCENNLFYFSQKWELYEKNLINLSEKRIL